VFVVPNLSVVLGGVQLVQGCVQVGKCVDCTLTRGSVSEIAVDGVHAYAECVGNLLDGHSKLVVIVDEVMGGHLRSS
jgi:hypothetical protein